MDHLLACVRSDENREEALAQLQSWRAVDFLGLLRLFLHFLQNPLVGGVVVSRIFLFFLKAYRIFLIAIVVIFILVDQVFSVFLDLPAPASAT